MSDGVAIILLGQEALASVVVPNDRCTENGREIERDPSNNWRYKGEYGVSLRASWDNQLFWCHMELVERGGGVFINLYPIEGSPFPFMRPNDLDRRWASGGWHHHISVVVPGQREGNPPFLPWIQQDAIDLARVKAYFGSWRRRVNFRIRELQPNWVARVAAGYPFTFGAGCLTELRALRQQHHGWDITISC